MSSPTSTPAPVEARQLSGPEAAELAGLAAVAGDLQHVLACCERLVTALAPARRERADAALVEALWTSALLAYARCFSARAAVLMTGDLDALGLPGDVTGFHELLLRLRDQYASADVNPRETCSVGAVEGEGPHEGGPVGVAVLAAPLPQVDEEAARQLGRLAYALGTRVDARMEEAQARVLRSARELPAETFRSLPVVRVEG